MPICIVTPRLPPAMDGLADYCYQLWHHWPSADKPQDFLVLDSANQSRKHWPQVEIEQFEPSEEDILSKLATTDADIVFLQYVGYGFDINGCPMWLPAALKKWLDDDGRRRLVIMFHETWSSGKPWQRVFWLMGKQKKCVSELMTLASAMGTSCEVNRHSLLALGIHKPIEIIPLGCSFRVDAISTKNWKQLLIFGKEYARIRGVRTHEALLKQLIEHGVIERIVLAGQSSASKDDATYKFIQEKLPQIEVTTAYNFNSSEVPESVNASGLSLMHTQSTHLLKSTSFHLAAKLGQVPIAEDSGPADAPFIDGAHYLSYPIDKPTGLLSVLKDASRLDSISKGMSQVASTHLSWKEIAATWNQLFKSLI